MSYCNYIPMMKESSRSIHQNYHDNHYGFPIHNDNELFGRLICMNESKNLLIDSTHTEPYADRLRHGLRTFDEFVTTALQHNLLTGKGGFAVSFYVLL